MGVRKLRKGNFQREASDEIRLQSASESAKHGLSQISLGAETLDAPPATAMGGAI